MRRQARQEGYQFKLVTDRHIGGWRLHNASFLQPYLHRTPAPTLEEAIAAVAATLCQAGAATTVREILLALYRSESNRLEAAPHVWRMVAMRRIWTNLDEYLDQDSPVWLVAGEGYKWTDPYRSR